MSVRPTLASLLDRPGGRCCRANAKPTDGGCNESCARPYQETIIISKSSRGKYIAG